MKGNWFYWLIGILLLINLILGIYNLITIRKPKPPQKESTYSSFSQNEESLYNSPSPDFSKKSVNGEEIRLSNLKGNAWDVLREEGWLF